MSASLAPVQDDSPPSLTTFERAFIRAVLEHRGLFGPASEADFIAALELLRAYDQQCADNPGGCAWEPVLNDEECQGELRGKAFVMFGATKPTPDQWHQAHTALFGPLLRDTYQ